MAPLGILPQNLKHLVAGHIRQAIFSGQLRPGQKIDQEALAVATGVSKLPVREALIALEGEALVQNVPRRGYFVARLTPDDIMDHYRLIGLVAGLAARRATVLADDEVLVQLNTTLDELEREDDKAAQEHLNYEFHRRINSLGGSRRLHSALRLLTNTMPSRFYELTPEWAKIAGPQHRRILDAIQNRDPDETDLATVDHISSGGEVVVQHLTEIHFWD